jgi:hypothetical protein
VMVALAARANCRFWLRYLSVAYRRQSYRGYSFRSPLKEHLRPITQHELNSILRSAVNLCLRLRHTYGWCIGRVGLSGRMQRSNPPIAISNSYLEMQHPEIYTEGPGSTHHQLFGIDIGYHGGKPGLALFRVGCHHLQRYKEGGSLSSAAASKSEKSSPWLSTRARSISILYPIPSKTTSTWAPATTSPKLPRKCPKRSQIRLRRS